MKNLRKAFPLAFALAGAALVTGCSDDLVDTGNLDIKDEYNKAFIRDFGVPDPTHDWRMATQAGLRIKSEKPVTVRVFAEIEGVRYIFADLGYFQGEHAVPVTIPKSVEKLIVEVNGYDYVCDANGMLDIDNPAPGSRSFTVEDENEDPERYGLSFSQDEKDKQVVEFKTEDNPWIKAIIERPWINDYVLTDSKNQPLFPNHIQFRAPIYNEETGLRTLGDIDVAPLYIKKTDDEVHVDPNGPDHIVGVVPYSNSFQFASNTRVALPYEDENYGIYCNGEGTTTPSTEDGNTWKITTYRINGRDYKDRSGISYWTIRNSELNYPNPQNRSAYTVKIFNSNYGNNEYWDAKFRTDCDANCSCLFYNVDVKLTDGSTRPATVYAIYPAPKTGAEPRPQNPDVFIIEFYPENSTLAQISTSTANHKYTWRIMAEDLGGIGDWDFNDVVFDYTDFMVSTSAQLFTGGDCPSPIGYVLPYRHEITVTPRAAGGTLPIYIAWEGNVMEPFDYNSLEGKMTSDLEKMEINQPKHEGVFVIGKEMHDWFGVSTSTMVNTTAGASLKSVESVTFVADYGTLIENFEPSFFNFHIIRDDNLEIKLDETTRAKFGWSKIRELNEDGSAYLDIQLPKYGGSYLAPQMMCVDTRIGWPTERTKISDAYTGFADWNEDKSNWNSWYNTNSNPSLIINVPQATE